MVQYSKNIGKLGEDLASNYLKQSKFTIIERNYKTNFGEIDIIALRDNSIYFIEVKTRSNINKGKPFESINYFKLKHLKKTINYYLLKNPKKNYKLKLAVISLIVTNNKIFKIDFYDDLYF